MKQSLEKLTLGKAGEYLVAMFKMSNRLHLVSHLIAADLISVLIPPLDRYKRSLSHVDEDKSIFSKGKNS